MHNVKLFVIISVTNYELPKGRALKMVENFNRIKEYRVKKGWSVKQLAAAMGYTEAYIRQIEGFKRGMSLSTAKQFSAVLGKSLNTLFMP